MGIDETTSDRHSRQAEERVVTAEIGTARSEEVLSDWRRAMSALGDIYVANHFGINLVKLMRSTPRKAVTNAPLDS